MEAGRDRAKRGPSRGRSSRGGPTADSGALSVGIAVEEALLAAGEPVAVAFED